MKIILLKDTPKVGKRGEIKEVNDGYAKNFLIAKGFGQVATADLQKKVAKEEREASAKKDRTAAKATELKQELEKRTFTLKVKVGDKGQIFGGVHEKDILAVINDKLNADLEKHQLDAHHGIKDLGIHTIKIKLGSGITAETKINLEPLTSS